MFSIKFVLFSALSCWVGTLGIPITSQLDQGGSEARCGAAWDVHNDDSMTVEMVCCFKDVVPFGPCFSTTNEPLQRLTALPVNAAITVTLTV